MTEPARPAPLSPRWATLLSTTRRDGSRVGTPVNLVIDGDRAYFGTGAKTAKVKRMRNFPDVEVAPCTPRGRATGPALRARARRLEGPEAEAARRRLRSRHPFVYRVLVPLELRLTRTHGLYYELVLAPDGH